MKVAFVISSLATGGAAKSVSLMANALTLKKEKVLIVTFDRSARQAFYPLDGRIKLVCLGLRKDSVNPVVGLWNNLKRIVTLRSCLKKEKPDLIISFMDKTNVLALLAARGLNAAVIVSERTEPSRAALGRLWENLRRYTYPMADRVVVQTQGARSHFSYLSLHSLAVIPNPVSVPLHKNSNQRQYPEPPFIISMGRLSAEKNFDLLMNVFAKIQDNHPDWKMVILGDGEERERLEGRRDRLGLKGKVFFPGQVQNPADWLRQAELFVLCSRFEGFPNALCEAMAHGLPVISTDCPSGPREIIRDGIDGSLVPDQNPEVLMKAMDHLMSDRPERKRLAGHAPEIIERFSLEKVMARWEELFNDVLERKAKRGRAHRRNAARSGKDDAG